MSSRALNDRQALVLQFAEFVAANTSSWKHDEMCDFLDTVSTIPANFLDLDRFHKLFSPNELLVLADLIVFEQETPSPLLENNPRCDSIQCQLIEFGIRFLQSDLTGSK